jgi:hypothetical protein
MSLHYIYQITFHLLTNRKVIQQLYLLSVRCKTHLDDIMTIQTDVILCCCFLYKKSYNYDSYIEVEKISVTDNEARESID